MSATGTNRLPGFSAEASVGGRRSGYWPRETVPDKTVEGLVLQGCSFWQWVKCAGAIAACAAACVSGVGTPACIECFIAQGAANCLSCL